MWEKITGWSRLLWDAGQQTQENRADIKQLRADFARVFQAIQTLAVENETLRTALQHERELRLKDLENLELKLRLQIAEELHRLPPGN